VKGPFTVLLEYPGPFKIESKPVALQTGSPTPPGNEVARKAEAVSPAAPAAPATPTETPVAVEMVSPPEGLPWWAYAAGGLALVGLAVAVWPRKPASPKEI
jgi:hypothetical protein